MTKVCVLLSAFNGEEFIEEQLQSLICQKGVEVEIVVRDDGSTDNTAAILDRWCEKGLLNWYGSENLGWAMSFIQLLCDAPVADYYAFSDHDDIWKPEKLEEAVKVLEGMPDDKKLYFSNLNYYREGKDEGLVKSANLRFDIYTALVKCVTLGCTMVMSRGLQQSIAQHPPTTVCAHDFWVYQVAMAIGTVSYDPRSFILYRQHAHNQIGQKRTWQEIWRRRLKRLGSLNHQHEREEMAIQLLDCHGSEMNEETINAVAKVANYRRSLKDRWSLFVDKRYTMGRRSNDFWLRLRILLGKL